MPNWMDTEPLELSRRLERAMRECLVVFVDDYCAASVGLDGLHLLLLGCLRRWGNISNALLVCQAMFC